MWLQYVFCDVTFFMIVILAYGKTNVYGSSERVFTIKDVTSYQIETEMEDAFVAKWEPKIKFPPLPK